MVCHEFTQCGVSESQRRKIKIALFNIPYSCTQKGHEHALNFLKAFFFLAEKLCSLVRLFHVPYDFKLSADKRVTFPSNKNFLEGSGHPFFTAPDHY